MFSQNLFIIFFILTILIFIVCTLTTSKLSSSETFNDLEKIQKENMEYNAKLVEQFDNGQIKFNKLEKASTLISKYQTFYNMSIYPELKNIDSSVIQKELINYIQKTNDNWIEWPEYQLWKHKKLSSWKIIPLMAFGKWSDKNTKNFPNTVSQLKNINGLVSAGFSKLGPKTTLKLHKGWGDLSNNILRCHLGLVVPKSRCKVFVLGLNNDMMYQKEGKWVIFDDSLYHSASNEDDSQDRIILLLDIKRPDNVYKGESDVINSDELNNFVDEFNKNL
jgi:aspartyl/asparaginyl beta-hydroxylase (cupin superfamily)